MNTIGTGFVVFLLLSLFIAPRGLAATDGAGYRLSGIMGSDPGNAFAVIENSSGEQQLLKEGSAIGSGYVKNISSKDKTVILSFQEQDITLRLIGSGMADEVQVERDEEQTYSISDFNEDTEQKTLEPDAVSRLLTLANDNGKFDENQLAAKVNELFGLREDAQIVAYDDQAVQSTRAVLEQLGVRISRTGEFGNFLGRIAVSDRNGRRRIYLMTETIAE
jgi:hypothetical protein